MKRMLISFAVAGVMGLTACSQDSGSTSDGLAGSAESSQVAAKAQLRLSVKFPDSDRAQAALIDDNTGLIAVRIRKSAAVTLDEFDQVGDYVLVPIKVVTIKTEIGTAMVAMMTWVTSYVMI